MGRGPPGTGPTRPILGRPLYDWPMPTDPVVDLLDQIWSSTAEACAGLTDEQWDAPTDCPGWSVRDQLSHMIGGEYWVAGLPTPTAVDPVPEHVHNPAGEMNEAWIEERRSWPGRVVLDEFVEVTRRRVAELTADSEERFQKLGPSPIGEVPYREFMWVRALDCWIHEQDLRRAAGRPGDRDGAAEALTIERTAGAMPFVVGRKVKPPEGSTVVWEVTGPLARTLAVGIEGGRGVLLEAVPTEPSAQLTLDGDTFWRLGSGRIDPGAALAAGSVELSGDPALGRSVVHAMNYMF